MPFDTPGGLAAMAGLLGLCVGSFLNVVIHRLPRMMEQDWHAQCADLRGETPSTASELTLARPRSRCPSCGHQISALENIPVIAYGIRTDFQTVAFPGSRRMLEIAHEIEELKTICRCGDKAIFNARIIDDTFVFEGTQMAIDDDHLTYESLCGACYLRHSRGSLNAGRRQWPVEFSFEPDADFS